jgi:ADP-ribosylglycohydrolase
MNELKEKYIATLVGCGHGDTLGMPVETWPKPRIQRYYGRITKPEKQKIILDENGKELKKDEFGKIRHWGGGMEAGEYTDDTIMTLPLAESLIECDGFNLDDVAIRRVTAYLDRVEEMKKRGAGSINGGFGGTTIRGFKNILKGVSPLESGVQGCGNGPCMAIAPLGIYMHKRRVYEPGLEFAVQISRMTHLDPRSIAAGVIQAHLVYSLLDDISKKDFFKSILDVCKTYEKTLMSECDAFNQGTLLQRLEWIKENKNASDEEALRTLGNSGAVFESYPFTLFMFQKYYNNPIEGLLETVNSGGDCDTTGAMFGALTGAKHGMIFPDEWNSVLKDIDKFKSLGERLYELK